MATSLTDAEIDKLYASGGDEGKYSSALGGTLLPDGTVRKPTYGTPTEANAIMNDVKGSRTPAQTSSSFNINTATYDEALAYARSLGIGPTPVGANATLGSLTVSADDQQMSQMEQYLRDQANQEVESEEDAYRRMLKMHQAEIDATNEIYRQQLNQARLEGRGRLGSLSALAGRSGLAGSPMAQSANTDIENYNAGIASGIQAEQNAKIGNIMGKVRDRALQEIKDKNAAKKEGVESYMSFLTAKKERRGSALAGIAQDLLDDDVDLNTINWKEFLGETGYTEQEIRSAYNSVKKDADSATAKADLEERKVALDEERNRVQDAYNQGRLTDAEYRRQISWYNAETNRINAQKSSSSGGTLGVANVRNLQSKTSLSGEEIKELDKMAFENGLVPTLNAQVAANIITQAEADAFKAEYEKALSMDEYFQSIIEGAKPGTPAPTGDDSETSLTDSYQN